MIRPWTPHDINRLLEIEEAVHVSPWDRDTFLMCMQQKYLVYVATKQSDINAREVIIGFAVLSVYAEECHILNLSVALAHQRQGIGKMLLTHALQQAEKNHQAKVAFLEVRRSNTRAIKLYQQLGFEQVAERKNYYPGPHEPEDALILVKLLSQPFAKNPYSC